LDESSGDGWGAEGNNRPANCGRAASGTPLGIAILWDTLLLYCLPLSRVGGRDVRNSYPIPAAVRSDWDQGIRDLLEEMERPIGAPRVIPFDDDGRELWRAFHDEIERNHGPGRRWEHMTDWTGKLPGAVARIAGLICLAGNGLSVQRIDRSSVDRAVQLGRLLIQHAAAAFALMGTSTVEEDAMAVARWIVRQGLTQFTRREAQRAMEGRFRTVDRLQGALQQLQYAAVIGQERSIAPPGDKGGRPSKCYPVNPKIKLLSGF